MSKKMLINATHPEENRVAIVEDGILTELDIEIAGKEQTKGNIYKAAVVRVEPGLQAAFIDYGGERFGFLQIGEIHPSYFRPTEGQNGEGRRPRINDVLRRGQELLVQVVKEERGTKGAALTTFLSLPGRYMVLMPESDTKGVSRKIEEESQRRKLKEAMASLHLPEQMGYIVRTAGIGQKKEELKRDFDYLVRVWEKLQEQARQARAPSLIYKESNLVIRSIRDYFSADMDEVLVDDPRVCQEAKDFFQEVMPEYARLVKLHQEKRPIFARYQIEEQIETITKNKVPLPSGGSIVIDATEALVAVDVNSGKMAGETNVETTAYKTNLEAAAETARQLRLRDLGGLIVIDFIDMRDRKHTREVEKTLKDSLKYDKARVTVGRISQFGLLEMSRQRIKAALAEGSFLPCPHCHGSGKVKSAEAQGIAFLRKIHAAIAKGQIGRVEGEIPLDVATYLLNTQREELLEMERRHQVMIVVKGRPDLLAGQAELTVQKREKGETPTFDQLPMIVPQPSLLSTREGGESEPAEVPAPSPAERVPQPAEAPMDLPAEAMAEEGKRKRKRKRRKKKPEEILAALPTAVEELPAEIEPQPAESEAFAAEEVSVAGEVIAGEAGEERKKKRRRRRRKKGTAPSEASVLSAPSLTPEEDGVPEPLPTPPVPPAPAESGTEKAMESAPARSRRPRGRKKPGTIPAAEAASPAPSAAAEPAPEPVVAEPKTSVEGKGKTKRPRVKKPATAPEEVPKAEGQPREEVAAEGPESGRKRASRRKSSGGATPLEMERPDKQEAPATGTGEEPKPKGRPPRKRGPAAGKEPETASEPKE